MVVVWSAWHCGRTTEQASGREASAPQRSRLKCESGSERQYALWFRLPRTFMLLSRFGQSIRTTSLFLCHMSSSGQPPLLSHSPLPMPLPSSGLLRAASCCFLCLAFAAFISAQTCPGRPLDAVTVQPTAPHTATMIFLHGLGDSGHGWSQADWNLPFAKLIFPNAPERPITVNGGARMPGWWVPYSNLFLGCTANDVTAIRFDIRSFDKNFENESNFDSDGFSQSKALIDDIIAREVAAGIPHNRIILGGFSQGGAVTLFTGLQAEHALGGLLVMSSWMPARWRFPGKEPNPMSQ